ncbi:survival motor neuron protein [Dictyocaulus viviparus]|uniref:Survival motor neuron protein n=1 Tax=Dictyocaulus viviparus TaxID=29172 RepID=A0A0D8XRC6_DICVI|nr:survival motor neuron protein [Dictyocaulus viviparus]
MIFNKANGVEEDGIDNEDVWDDTELIKMYEHAVSATYSKLGASPMRKAWSIGDSCLARYYEDNLFYPAKILEIKRDESTLPEYLVLYKGYGNTDWVSYDDLTQATSDDSLQEGDNEAMDSSFADSPNKLPLRETKIRKDQQKPTGGYRKEADCQNTIGEHPHPTIPSIAPPPPSVFSGISQPNESEALSSMLMSWYMSGYHTGYYQSGVTQEIGAYRNHCKFAAIMDARFKT